MEQAGSTRAKVIRPVLDIGVGGGYRLGPIHP
jgi:hypothetical protein